MAVLTGVFRLGSDAKIVEGRNGNFLNLNMAYDAYDAHEKQNVTQWVRATYFGQRAENMAQYLKKGGAVEATVADLRMTTFQGRDGETKTAMEGNVIRLDFVNGQRQQQDAGGGQSPPRQERPKPPSAPAPTAAHPGAEDMSDEPPLDDEPPF